MQALFYTGETSKPFAWQSLAEPTLVETTDALVEPIAIAACDLDRRIYKHSPFPGPFPLGHEFTGRVLSVGGQVNNIKQGDLVLASFQPSCGICSHCGIGHSSVCDAVSNGSMYGIGKAGGDWSGAITDKIRVPWADANLIVLPESLDPVSIASGSDNLADALRCIDAPLLQRPGASVLIAGQGSIALYAVALAKSLGAGDVSFASTETWALETAEALGAECHQVSEWPGRFRNHDITVDCTGQVAGLNAVLRSTSGYGDCTSASIYFEGDVTVPMFNLNMKGIRFTTGRVNSASQLQRVLEVVADGFDPDVIKPAYRSFDEAIGAFESEPYSRKLILKR